MAPQKTGIGALDSLISSAVMGHFGLSREPKDATSSGLFVSQEEITSSNWERQKGIATQAPRRRGAIAMPTPKSEITTPPDPPYTQRRNATFPPVSNHPTGFPPINRNDPHNEQDGMTGSTALPIPQAPAPTAPMLTKPIKQLEKHEIAPRLLQAMSKRAAPPKPKDVKPKKAKPVPIAGFRCTPLAAIPVHRPQSTGQKSHLLSLPDDVRNRIYAFALVDDEPIALLPRRPYLREPGLLRTCRQIRTSALPIFYGHNAFDSRFHYDIFQWLERLTPTKLKLLQCVQLVTPQPAGFVKPSLRELTKRQCDGLNPEAISVAMHVQGEKGWMTWVTLGELDEFDCVGGKWDVKGLIVRKRALKRKRED